MASTPLGTFGQACKQCQKCYKQESSDLHLLLCSRCHLNHYCSTACQQSDWPDHKLQCNLNRDNDARLKESEEQDKEQQMSIHSAKAVHDRLRKWLQVHRPLIHVTLIHALSLQRTPDMCMSHVLSIFVTPNFTSTSSSDSSKDIAQSFLVQRTSIRPFNEVIEDLGDIGPQ